MQYTLWLAPWIILLCSAGMTMTFINDALQSTGFFGDVKTDIHLTTQFIDRGYEWGNRHYWYWWMCVALFLLNIIRISIWSDNYFNTDKQ